MKEVERNEEVPHHGENEGLALDLKLILILGFRGRSAGRFGGG